MGSISNLCRDLLFLKAFAVSDSARSSGTADREGIAQEIEAQVSSVFENQVHCCRGFSALLHRCSDMGATIAYSAHFP